MFMFSGLDILLALILLFFFTLGFVYGFIHALGLIAGVVVGLWAANEYFQSVAAWANDTIPFLGNTFSWLSGSVVEVISFVVIGVVVFKLVALAFEGIDRLLRIMYVIPFMKSINRFLGAIIGLGEAVLMLSLFFHFIDRVDFLKQISTKYTEDSILAEYLLNIGANIAPILPNLLNGIKNLIV